MTNTYHLPGLWHLVIIISQTDAKGQTFNMVYDILGRLTTKSGPDGTTTYSYVPNGNGTGQIQTITGPSPAGITQSITYDSYGRPTQLTENIPGDQSFTTALAYDTWNNNTSVTYPSGLIINNVYTNGYLKEIKKSDGTSIWKLDSINGMGQPVQYSLGSNSDLQTHFTYNSFADLTMKAMGQRVQTFAFDSLNGNITERTHKTPGHPLLRESFSYDNRNRLDSLQVYGKTAIALTYDDSGNILSKTGIGSYVYDGTHVNRLDSIASPGALMPQTDQLLTFTSENLTSSITQDNYELQIKYNPGNQRIKTILKEDGNTIKTKYFSGNYEKEVIGSVERHLHYIYSPFGLIAVITKQSSTETLYYTETDHLGSIIGLVTPEGSYAERFSYDAWGRRRNPFDWTYDSVPTPTLIDRGFTGHEHLDIFDLINMNGRIYDPVIGRFLSVDPFIQSPGNAQNFNGYGYCLNNPLSYTDPTGMLLEPRINPVDEGHPYNPEAEAWLANYYAQSFGGGGGGGGVDLWDKWMYAVNNGFTGTMDKFERESRENHNGLTGFWVKETHYGGTIRFPNGLGGYGEISNIEIINRFVPFDASGGGGYDFVRTNNAFSFAGIGWGINELALYNKDFWLGKNLKYNSILWGGNKATGARSLAKSIARPAKIFGRVAFGVNLMYGGYNVFSGVANGNYSKAVFSGLGTIYSGIATYGGIPGMIIAGPMVLIDATIGLDNFWQNGVNMHIERANRINQGDYSMMWYTPGRSMR